MQGVVDASQVSASYQWKDIEGFDGLYQICKEGKVRITKQLNNFGLPAGAIIKNTLGGAGYFQVTLKRKRYNLHRLIAKVFVQNPEGKPYINHINGIRSDNRLENMEWVTPSENTRHGFALGLMCNPKGRYKISDETIAKMRETYARGGVTRSKLAKEFGIGERYALEILSGRCRIVQNTL